MIEWIWQQVSVSLPAEWECLQYSREPEQGRCAFADRSRFRFEWNWRRFKSEPDFPRMLKDYAASLQDDWEGITSIKCRSWPGLTGRRGNESVSRYGRYFPEIERLVELVFIHPAKRDAELEASILATVRAVPPDGEGFQRWRAFGMDLRVPSSFTLAECVVEPARVGLRFEGAHKPDRWIFRRYGMVRSWLKTSVGDWLNGQVDPQVRDARTSHSTRRGMDIVRVEGRWRPAGLLLPRGVYSAAAWQDPGDQRLYHLLCITGKKSAHLRPRDGADHYLASCPDFLVVPASVRDK